MFYPENVLSCEVSENVVAFSNIAFLFYMFYRKNDKSVIKIMNKFQAFKILVKIMNKFQAFKILSLVGRSRTNNTQLTALPQDIRVN